MHVTIDFDDTSTITRSNYRITHFLVSFRTVTTPNAENNSWSLPGKYSIVCQFRHKRIIIYDYFTFNAK